MPNDTKTVVKVVIIDKNNKVLMLKRSSYVKKFAKEWDLPGGHIKKGEKLQDGLAREVEEETGVVLDTENVTFLEKIENIHFFKAKYNGDPIKLSHEHTEFTFFEKNQLDSQEKFQKVAISAIKE